jgi:carbon storage regulator CsrA
MFLTGRKVGDEIFLGEDIRILIKEIDGSTVKIGIEAPRELKISIPAAERKKKPVAASYEF